MVSAGHRKPSRPQLEPSSNIHRVSSIHLSIHAGSGNRTHMDNDGLSCNAIQFCYKKRTLIAYSSMILYSVCVFCFVGAMDELHSLDPRRQELLEARFTGVVSGSTGSTGSCSVGAKVSGYMDSITFLKICTFK